MAFEIDFLGVSGKKCRWLLLCIFAVRLINGVKWKQKAKIDITLIRHNGDGVDDERQSVVYVQLINFSRTKNTNDDDEMCDALENFPEFFTVDLTISWKKISIKKMLSFLGIATIFWAFIHIWLRSEHWLADKLAIPRNKVNPSDRH